VHESNLKDAFRRLESAFLARGDCFRLSRLSVYRLPTRRSSEWGTHCGVHDRPPDRRDIGDRTQLRAEIDACVAHLYDLSRDDFAYILKTFPVLKKKEEKAFGEFMLKRQCLEEYDRIVKVPLNQPGW